MPLVLSGSSGLSGNVGTTTPAMMYAGAVLQVQSAYNLTQITATGNVDVVTQSIVVSANSRVVVAASIAHYSEGSGTWGGSFITGLRQNDTQVLNHEHVGTVTAGVAQCHQVPVNWVTPALTAGTYTFVVRCGPIIGGTHTYNRDGRPSTITLTEIKG